MIIKPEVSKAENKKKKNKINKSTSGICEGKKSTRNWEQRVLE